MISSEDSGYKYDEDDKELAFYTELALHETERWIQIITRQKFSAPDDARASLCDGKMLCQLLNCLKPGVISRINQMSTKMAGLDNLSVFLSTCRNQFALTEGQLFDVSDLEDISEKYDDDSEDLYEQESDRRLRNVALTIFWLAKSIQSWYDGPQLDYSSFSELLAHPATREKESNQVLPSSPDSQSHYRTQSCDSAFTADYSTISDSSSHKDPTTNESDKMPVPDDTMNKDIRYSATFDAVYDSTHEGTYDSSHDGMYDSQRDDSDTVSNRSDEPAHQQRGPLIVGNRAGIGAPQPSAPPTNPLQFISNQGNKNKMAEQAKQTMDKLKEQKHHGKQNKLEETDDIDWQSNLSSWKMRRRQASNRSGESLSSFDNSEESSPASKPKTFGEIMKSGKQRFNIYPYDEDMQTSTPRSDRSSTGSPEVTEQSRSTGVLEHTKSSEVTEKPRSRLPNSDEGRGNERQSRNSLEFDNNQGYQPEVRSYAQSRSPDRELSVFKSLHLTDRKIKEPLKSTNVKMDSKNKNISIPVRREGARHEQEGAKLSQEGAKLSLEGARHEQEGAKLSQVGAKLSQEGAKLIIDSSNRADFTAGRGSSKPIPPPKPKRVTVQDEAETKKPSSEYRPSVKFLTPTQYAYMPNMQQDVINVDLDDEMVEVNAKVAESEERHQESCQGEEMGNKQNVEVTLEQNAEVTEETEVLEKVDTSKLIKNFESYFKHLKVTDLTDKLNEPKGKPASRPKSMDLSFLSKTQRTDRPNTRSTPKPPRPTSQDSTWSSTVAQQQADLIEYIPEREKADLRLAELSELSQESRVSKLHKSFSNNSMDSTSKLTKKVIRIIRPPGYNRGFGFGLRGEGNGEALVVESIVKGSPADICELERGDLVEEIDGMCVRHKNRKAVLTLISNASETGQLQLTVTRNEEKNSDDLNDDSTFESNVQASVESTVQSAPRGEESDSDTDAPPPLPDEPPPPLPSAPPPGVQAPGWGSPPTDVKPPPPVDRRVDRHDSVERIKTDIVKKRSEFLGLDVEESDEYHMIKIERAKKRQEDEKWRKNERQNVNMSPRQMLLDDIRGQPSKLKSPATQKESPAPYREAPAPYRAPQKESRPSFGVDTSFELEKREQQIIENLERQEREKSKPLNAADKLRSWKSMDYLKKSHDLEHVDDHHGNDGDMDQSGGSMYGNLRGAKSCVDLDVHKQRMEEWEEKQKLLRQDSQGSYKVEKEIALAPQEQFNRNTAMIKNLYDEDLKRSAQTEQKHKEQEADMLKNELKYQKELQYQRQTSKKMFADEKSRHSPEKESYPWKYITPEEIQWEEEQARLKAEEQLQRQNEVEQKLAAEKQTLRERAEDQARHLEADQMQNLENRRKYMEEHERFMAEQDARRQQLKEEHDREMAEQRRKEEEIRRQQRELAEQRREQEKEQLRIELENERLKAEREKIRAQEEERRREMERQKYEAEQSRLAELENDRFEQLLKMQREGEEDRKKSEMERREQQRNEEYRKQKSLRDDEEILQERIERDAERLKMERANIYPAEHFSKSEYNKVTNDPSYHIILAPNQKEPITAEVYNNQSQPPTKMTFHQSEQPTQLNNQSQPRSQTIGNKSKPATVQNKTGDTRSTSDSNDNIAWLGAMAGAWDGQITQPSDPPHPVDPYPVGPHPVTSPSYQPLSPDTYVNNLIQQKQPPNYTTTLGNNPALKPRNDNVNNPALKPRSDNNAFESTHKQDNVSVVQYRQKPGYNSTENSRTRYNQDITTSTEHNQDIPLHRQSMDVHTTSHQRWSSNPHSQNSQIGRGRPGLQHLNMPPKGGSTHQTGALQSGSQSGPQPTRQLSNKHESQRSAPITPDDIRYGAYKAREEALALDKRSWRLEAEPVEEEESFEPAPSPLYSPLTKESLHNIGAAPKKQLIQNNQWMKESAPASHQGQQQSQQQGHHHNMHRLGMGRAGLENQHNQGRGGSDYQHNQGRGGSEYQPSQGRGVSDHQPSQGRGGSEQQPSSTHVMEHTHEPDFIRRHRPIPESIKQTLVHRVNKDDRVQGEYQSRDDYRGQNDGYRGPSENYRSLTDNYRPTHDPYNNDRARDAQPVNDLFSKQTQNMNQYNTERDRNYQKPYIDNYHTQDTHYAPTYTPSYTQQHSYPDIIASVDPYNQGLPPANHPPVKPPRLLTHDDAPVAAHYLPTVSGRYICTFCEQPLGHGSSMLIDSLQLHYHHQCFICTVCNAPLYNVHSQSSPINVLLRAAKLHCEGCFTNDSAGLKFSRV